MKRTPEDDTFALQFGELLEAAYDLAKQKNVTDQAFAESIGVERPQLRKYFRGSAVPSIRTVALAQRKYGINVPYASIEVGPSLGRRSKSKVVARPVQLRLPFSLDVAEPGRFDVELKKIKSRKYELRIREKRA